MLLKEHSVGIKGALYMLLKEHSVGIKGALCWY